MINTILLATDGSAAAERAADYAASLAVRYQASVTVLHAYARLSRSLGEPHLSQILHKTLEEAQSLVDGVAARLREAGAHEVSTDVLEGSATDAILAVAAGRKPDLLVVGARGMSAWQGIFLGSVSMALTQRAECPVLVVK